MKDPAFLFYPADASEDTQFMNRLERGCYFDILKAQKKFGRFSIESIKKVLGKDFDECWSALETVLKKDDTGYFIEWADDAIEKRKAFSESRRQNRSRSNNSDLFIYLMIETISGRYKIGSSINPYRRELELRNSHPTIKLVYSFGKTTQTTEAELHKMFSDKRVFNEFFELEKKDIEHIIVHMTKHMKLDMTEHIKNDMSLHMGNHMVNENENVIIDNKGNENTNITIGEDFQEIRKNENIKQLAAYAHSAMKDQMWREAMARAGIVDRPLLAEWVKVFVKKLVFENDIEKTEAEFRKYFKNWVVKCENYHTSLNYEKYDPSYEHPKQQIPASEQFRPIVINKQIDPDEQ